MADIEKAFLTMYILSMIVTAPSSLKLYYEIYVTKKYKDVFDAGMIKWMAIFFFWVANLCLLGTFIYQLL